MGHGYGFFIMRSNRLTPDKRFWNLEFHIVVPKKARGTLCPTSSSDTICGLELDQRPLWKTGEYLYDLDAHMEHPFHNTRTSFMVQAFSTQRRQPPRIRRGNGKNTQPIANTQQATSPGGLKC